MPETETAEVDRCEFCGQPCDDGDGRLEELRMQLTRGDDGDVLYWAGDFCSQEHAAEWLSRPLPDALTPSPAPGPTTWGDARRPPVTAEALRTHRGPRPREVGGRGVSRRDQMS